MHCLYDFIFLVHLVRKKNLILLSLITQVLSNKAKYSPNENAQESGSANVEAPSRDNIESTSASSLSADE